MFAIRKWYVFMMLFAIAQYGTIVASVGGMKANTKTVSIRLPIVLWKMSKFYCLRHEISMQQFLIECISKALRTAEVTDTKEE